MIVDILLASIASAILSAATLLAPVRVVRCAPGHAGGVTPGGSASCVYLDERNATYEGGVHAGITAAVVLVRVQCAVPRIRLDGVIACR